jgi:hypothetical protein
MANKHSPAPWTVTSESRGGRYITVKAADGRTVARVPFSSEAEGEAGTATDAGDADVIAAAPKLVALMRTLVDRRVNYEDFGAALAEGRALVAALPAPKGSAT